MNTNKIMSLADLKNHFRGVTKMVKSCLLDILEFVRTLVHSKPTKPLPRMLNFGGSFFIYEVSA